MSTANKEIFTRYLRSFNNFSDEEIDCIQENISVQSFPKGAIIHEIGEVADTCYFLLKGCVRQFQIVEGEEKNIAFFLDEMPVISYHSYLEGGPSTYSFSCIEDSVLLAGSREQGAEIRRRYPRLEFLTHLLLQYDFAKLQERLASFINLSAEHRYQLLMEANPSLFQRVPLHHLASYIGVTPESLSRLRKRLHSKGRASWFHRS